MERSIDKKRVKLYLWLALTFSLLFSFHSLSTYPGIFLTLWLNDLWRVCYLTLINFIFFEYAVSFVLRKRKYIIYNVLLGVVVLWVFMMFWSFGMYAWRSLGISLHIYTELKKYDRIDAYVAGQMGFSAASICYYGIIRHIYNYIKLKQSTQQLRIEKQQAELNYLKSQTNPHFLFNTLNNIYSLSRDKSDLAPESIVRLSKILRFMLYEAGGEYISVEQEIKIITDYIALEKLRYDDSLQVNFNHNVEDMRQALPPLLLIPLVENAFKHGASETRDHPFIDMHLSINKRQLKFEVKNSVEMTSSESGIRENIGLSNLRRQLQLLYKEYDLSFQRNGTSFIATLTINLSSHV